MNRAQAIEKGWLTEDGKVAGGGYPLVAPVKPKPATSDVETSAWRAHARITTSGIEPDAQQAPEAEETRLSGLIPPDTVRRLKFPCIEIVHRDGSRTFRHDPLIRDDARIAR
jgi:hypothetical protein